MTQESDDTLRGRAWEGVADAIRAGGFQPGDRLPPERELAERLGVSRSTLRLALHDMERAGVLTRRPGRGGGTFVAVPRVERDLGSFAGLGEYIRRQGLEAGARVIGLALTTADAATAEALRIRAGAPVVSVDRVRLAGGEPIAVERSRFPAERFPGLAERALGGSLYDLMREEYGLVPVRAVERIEPVAADLGVADLLGIDPGTPLLAVERIAYDADDIPLEHANDLFRGDRTRVTVWTTPPS
jgi:GntR family transcriptional regulator